MQQANRKVERVAHPAAAMYTKYKAKPHIANRIVAFFKHFTIFLTTENTPPTLAYIAVQYHVHTNDGASENILRGTKKRIV